MQKLINFLGKDITIHLHNNETVSNIIKSTSNFFEKDFLYYILENYKTQKKIIDIGSNIGNHSLFFSEFLNYEEIICFEPFEDNVNLLRKNLDGKKCQIYDLALSDNSSEKVLYNSQKENFGGYSLHYYDGSKGENKSFIVRDKIVTKTLDSFNFENVTMIKIDVEGHENNVLKGAINTIQMNKPIIFIENLSHGYPHLFVDSQFDVFFNEVNYIRIQKNISGSFMDLWIPKN